MFGLFQTCGMLKLIYLSINHKAWLSSVVRNYTLSTKTRLSTWNNNLLNSIMILLLLFSIEASLVDNNF